MGYKDEAGSATSDSKGSPFDPQLGASATPAQGSVFQADSFASSDPAQGSVFSGSDLHTRGPEGFQGPQGIGIDTVTGDLSMHDRNTDVTVTFNNPAGPNPGPMMFTVQHGLDATASAVEIGFLAPGHEDHSGGENDGEIIIGNNEGEVISALPVDVRATSTIIADDNGLVGIENGRIVLNVSTLVQSGDERPVTSAAVFAAVGDGVASAIEVAPLPTEDDAGDQWLDSNSGRTYLLTTNGSWVQTGGVGQGGTSSGVTSNVSLAKSTANAMIAASKTTFTPSDFSQSDIPDTHILIYNGLVLNEVVDYNIVSGNIVLSAATRTALTTGDNLTLIMFRLTVS